MLAQVTQTLTEELKARPLTLFTLLALSAYALWSYHNHAFAADVDRINDKLDKLLVINLRSAIQERRAEYCHTNDHSLRTILQRTINELAESYREITGEPYRFESCNDLMARNGN